MKWFLALERVSGSDAKDNETKFDGAEVFAGGVRRELDDRRGAGDTWKHSNNAVEYEK